MPLAPRPGSTAVPLSVAAAQQAPPQHYMPPLPPGAQKTAREGRYPCYNCDRGFDSQRDYDAHVATHETCPRPGCTFRASHRALMEHASRDHKPGLRANAAPVAAAAATAAGGGANGNDDGEGDDEEGGGGGGGGGGGPIRMPPSLLEIIPPKYRGAWRVGNSPAEIARWREERRKFFPSAAVVASKAAVMQARQARGDIIDDSAAATSGSSSSSSSGGAAAAATTTNAAAGVKRPRPAGSAAVVSAAGAGAAAAADSDDDDDDGVGGSRIVFAASDGDGNMGSAVDMDATDGPPEEAGVISVAGAAAAHGAASGDTSATGPPAKRARLGEADDAQPSAAVPAPPQLKLGMMADEGDAGAAVGAAPREGGSGYGGRAFVPARPSRPVCHMFARGKCRNGSSCRYSHDPADRAAAEALAAGAAGGRFGARPGGAMLVQGSDGVLRPTQTDAAKSAPACRHFLIGVCRRGAGCPFSHGAAELAASRSSLLRKLLQPDEHRETRFTLQAIRYIVNNGFFCSRPSGGVAEATSSSTAARATDATAAAAATDEEEDLGASGAVDAEAAATAAAHASMTGASRSAMIVDITDAASGSGGVPIAS